MVLKIHHLITSLQGGGSENYLHQLLSCSPADFGHEVLFLKEDGVIGERIRKLGVRVRNTNGPLALYRLLCAEKPDVVHTNLYRAHQWGRVIGALAKVPFVVSSQQSIDIWQRPWQRVLDTWTLRLCDLALVNSQAAEHLVANRRGSREHPRIAFVRNGIDLKKWVPTPAAQARALLKLPAGNIILGSLMRLHSEKGADRIPEFAQRLIRRFPNLHIAIAGTGAMEKPLREEIQRAGLASQVHFLGWQDDAATFLSAIDAFFLLSREESFPQALLEASAMGLPWTAPDVGGVRELVTEGAIGRVFNEQTPEKAEASAHELLSDWPLPKEQAQKAGAKIREEHSLEKMAAAFYQRMRDLAAHR